MEAQGEAAIKKYKVSPINAFVVPRSYEEQVDIATLHASVHAYDTQLLDPGLTRLNVTYLSFLMTWLTRLVDPKHAHPTTPIS